MLKFESKSRTKDANQTTPLQPVTRSREATSGPDLRASYSVESMEMYMQQVANTLKGGGTVAK